MSRDIGGKWSVNGKNRMQIKIIARQSCAIIMFSILKNVLRQRRGEILGEKEGPLARGINPAKITLKIKSSLKVFCAT